LTVFSAATQSFLEHFCQTAFYLPAGVEGSKSAAAGSSTRGERRRSIARNTWRQLRHRYFRLPVKKITNRSSPDRFLIIIELEQHTGHICSQNTANAAGLSMLSLGSVVS
jgi:hypothetical protein